MVGDECVCGGDNTLVVLDCRVERIQLTGAL